MYTHKKFLIKEFVLTASIGIVAFVLFKTILREYYLNIFWVLLATIAVLTGAMHMLIVNASKKSVAKFTSHFMMITGIKMMIYLVFITTYVLLNPHLASAFLISFFILYLFYTTFEVVIVVRHLKKQKNNAETR